MDIDNGKYCILDHELQIHNIYPYTWGSFSSYLVSALSTVERFQETGFPTQQQISSFPSSVFLSSVPWSLNRPDKELIETTLPKTLSYKLRRCTEKNEYEQITI